MAGNRIFVRTFAVVAFYGILAGDSLRYSVTWIGWGAIALAIFAVSIVLLVRSKDVWRFNRLPYPLIGFVVLTFLSIAWSAYPQWTLAAAFTNLVTVVIGTALAITLTKEDLIWALGWALRIVLAVSLLFELVIALFVRQPIIPWWEDFTGLTIHNADYWSRDLLFTGQRIQGIMGNSNLLGFAALLALIVFVLQLASRRVHVFWGIFWVAVAVLCIALTRSGTVTIAAAAVVVVAAVLLLLRSTRTARGRAGVGIASIAVIVVGVILAFVFQSKVLELLGKNSTFTGRKDIWAGVIALAQERPVAGWGWISYWVPNIKPFDSSVFTKGGVQYLQAHEAWLDVWFQLGVIGLIVFGALVLSIAVRVWILALDRHAVPAGARGPYSAVTMLPVLILVALLAQSLAESRLLIEYGILFLTLFAVRSKRDLLGPSVS